MLSLALLLIFAYLAYRQKKRREHADQIARGHQLQGNILNKLHPLLHDIFQQNFTIK